jgi:hypothetical protein
MFVSIRRYRLTRGAMDELVRRVDDGFSEEVRLQPGFVSYEFVDCGGGEIMTISRFETAEQAEHSRELAQRWTEEHLRDLEFARIEAVRGEVRVSRAADEALRPVHAETSSG